MKTFADDLTSLKQCKIGKDNFVGCSVDNLAKYSLDFDSAKFWKFSSSIDIQNFALKKSPAHNERFHASGGAVSSDTEQVTSSFALVRASPMPPPA